MHCLTGQDRYQLMTFNGLEISEVSVELGGKRVLQSINVSLEAGNVLAVLGPSGCGKSTLLKVIAGIVTPTDGQIFWNSSDVLKTPVHKRGIGLMFQNNALFPHMSVHENIRFGLRVPHIDNLLSPILLTLPLQMLAYHVALLKNCDVDKPRNLAKSVTVE